MSLRVPGTGSEVRGCGDKNLSACFDFKILPE